MLDDPRTVAAAIAFVGVLISVVSSIAVSKIAAINDRNKIKQELHNSYSDKILSERIRTYPELYDIISTLAKNIYDGSFKETGHLSRVREAIRNWDGKNAIFMSGQTQHDMWRFRTTFDDFTADFDKVDEESQMQNLEEVWSSLVRLEISLKSDIGIFVLDEYDGKETFVDYRELNDKRRVD